MDRNRHVHEDNQHKHAYVFVLAVRRQSGGESGFSYVNVDPYPFALRGECLKLELDRSTLSKELKQESRVNV